MGMWVRCNARARLSMKAHFERVFAMRYCVAKCRKSLLACKQLKKPPFHSVTMT